jgi:hypothetical protein
MALDQAKYSKSYKRRGKGRVTYAGDAHLLFSRASARWEDTRADAGNEITQLVAAR